MTKPESATPDYTLGFSEEVHASLRQHTAENSAAYLLPHLKPGLRLLDFGCGIGTISVGLAKAVDPGEMHGVDMAVSELGIANRIAQAGGHDNTTFHVGDVTDLPFDDDFFDVAHCHNVLMHVPDTAAVLREVKRVLKPGGIIASREMICDSCFTHPHYGVLQRAWEMFGDLLAADDGHPQMGKDLKGHVVEAGYTNIRVSTSFDTYGTTEDVALRYDFSTKWFLSPETTDAAIKYGAATQELCDAMRVAYDKWIVSPGAFAALAFGEVIASKP